MVFCTVTNPPFQSGRVIASCSWYPFSAVPMLSCRLLYCPPPVAYSISGVHRNRPRKLASRTNLPRRRAAQSRDLHPWCTRLPEASLSLGPRSSSTRIRSWGKTVFADITAWRAFVVPRWPGYSPPAEGRRRAVFLPYLVFILCCSCFGLRLW